MKLYQQLRVILLVFLSFGLYYILYLNFKPIKIALDKVTHQGLVSYVLTYLLIGIPIVLGTMMINKNKSILTNLGLSSNLITGLWVSALFTIPMFIGGALLCNFNDHHEIDKLLAGTIVAGFMEEIYFRGFLFGQLFRKTNLGFVASIFWVPCYLPLDTCIKVKM